MARTIAGMLYEASNRPAPAVVLVHMLGRSKDEWIRPRRASAGRRRHGADHRPARPRPFGGQRRTLSPMVSTCDPPSIGSRARAPSRPSSIGLVGASLGANLAALAAADSPAVRAVALLSPSLDYRGVRLDADRDEKARVAAGVSRRQHGGSRTRCAPSRSWRRRRAAANSG